MQNAGTALLGIGTGVGENRAQMAARAAVSSPLLDLSMDGATGVLFNITGGNDLTMFEVDEAARIISNSADTDANIIFGAVIKQDLADQIRITVIATGFDETSARIARFAKPTIEPKIEGIVSEGVHDNGEEDEEDKKEQIRFDEPDDDEPPEGKPGEKDVFGEKFEIPLLEEKDDDTPHPEAEPAETPETAPAPPGIKPPAQKSSLKIRSQSEPQTVVDSNSTAQEQDTTHSDVDISKVPQWKLKDLLPHRWDESLED